MKKYIIILFAFISSFAYSQYDFQAICLACAVQEGFYCGDDPTNWTQYSPNGCVQNTWINDGWEDCVDAADENAEGPTLPTECGPPPPEGCDTVFVYEDVLDTLYVDVIEYVDVIVYDTIIETEYVEFIEYITEYVDCDTGLPCNVSIDELLDKSKRNSVIYNINGQAIRERQGLYIENGKLYYNE